MTPRRRKAGDGAGEPAPSTLSREQLAGKAMEAALRLLSVRERSEAELRKRLTEKGFDTRIVEQVLERLRDTGLQDDGRFAERFAAEAAARGKAARLIQRELAGKGIDRELAASAATASPEDEAERAFALAARRARGMASLEPRVRVQRLAGLLARRGFEAEVCWRVAREVAGPHPDDDANDDANDGPEGGPDAEAHPDESGAPTDLG